MAFSPQQQAILDRAGSQYGTGQQKNLGQLMAEGVAKGELKQNPDGTYTDIKSWGGGESGGGYHSPYGAFAKSFNDTFAADTRSFGSGYLRDGQNHDSGSFLGDMWGGIKGEVKTLAPFAAMAMGIPALGQAAGLTTAAGSAGGLAGMSQAAPIMAADYAAPAIASAGAGAAAGAGAGFGSAPAWYTPEVANGTAPGMYAGTGGAATGAATGAAGTAASSLIPGISNNSLGSLASGAASLYGASQTAGAANDATAETRRQFDIGQANTKPWLDAGKGALTEQQKLMGINGYDPANSLAALTSSPGYQFRLGQGQQALDRSAAAKGMLNSGNVLAATTEYGQNFGTNEYGNRLNQLAGLSGTGQTQANTNANAGSAFASDVGNAGMKGASAWQSGILGAGQSLSNFFNPPQAQPSFKMGANGQWSYS